MRPLPTLVAKAREERFAMRGHTWIWVLIDRKSVV